MGPSGHQLLPKFWRVARFAFEKASRAVRTRLPEPGQSSHLQFQPIYARIQHRQPINRIAAIRQTQSRHFSTVRASRRFATGSIQSSKIRTAISRLTTRTPFASTLRPNLTGGTLCRTAGGYAVGAGRIGGVRYFSSSPTCPAQVVQNVSAGVRAFWLSGQRARFDGVDNKTGRKQYKIVTSLQEEANRKMNAVPRTAAGSYIDFKLSPTITAFGCLDQMQKSSVSKTCEQINLNTPTLMDLLSADFARALKEFAAVLNDLKKIATLGDLPLSLHDQSTIRVRFPGCDAESVERLCVEVGVQRGIIHQDPDFEAHNGTEMALLFPFAPSHQDSEADLFYFDDPPLITPDKVDWRQMMVSDPTRHSTGANWRDYQYVSSVEKNPWARSHSEYSSVNISDLGDRAFFGDIPEATAHSVSDCGGFEGIYKFLEECDRARR
ncbi:hypothetical protein D8B26_007340 [Coccidioides posadasii str. Silveira]|uniref:Uncharacterized protein n=2 Tax=Coccidioides posadasii TaxID=199306 RepID=E9D3H8_COCPS|nr:hypothetical protein CPC735_013720 [Coccidioides posadasii C735 delta SOWgp]EER30054.1 hypothetical protein CPC735_013720 [Coccidioides posadasii C735 delta SOWgp]EFW19173.1 conserved hypothetical protein [Coccidioides posadasii str. Silveira]QVM12722.1 hypothetical protein D8B26_007340 [Coccidioides posadasii str. Silveira]|eukprot:XP_003072199.1 hypothetical protein CPC735_013720 [Coccidioides posadasii C735 delta SOWgp]